jgi:hypothetical protein
MSYCPRKHVLNFTARLAGSWLVRGSILDSIFMPSERAFGGMSERKSRAGFERREKGLKVTRTSVRNRVIMIVAVCGWRGVGGGLSAIRESDRRQKLLILHATDVRDKLRSQLMSRCSVAHFKVDGPCSARLLWRERTQQPAVAPRFEPLRHRTWMQQAPFGNRLDTMPPLPSTTQALTTRLTALSESNKAIVQLIQRLAKLDFQPGSQPLGTEEGDVRLELSAEIHESLKGIEEDLELLRQEVEDVIGGSNSSARRRDSKTESERSRLAVLLARLTEDLKS